MTKTTVSLDSEIVQPLLRGDLTYFQSVVKDLIEYALEAKVERDLGIEKVRADSGPERLPQQVSDDPARTGLCPDALVIRVRKNLQGRQKGHSACHRRFASRIREFWTYRWPVRRAKQAGRSF